MKHYSIIILSIIALITTSCGDNDNFRVMASVEGLGTQNVRAVYYADGRLNTIPTTALDGSFQFIGSAKEPVFIDIFTTSRALIGSLVARNGETVEVKYKLNEPGFMVAKGNSISSDLASFITQNSQSINNRDAAAVNRAIESYIANNPRSKAAPYILLSQYNPALNPTMADSLLRHIDPKVRPDETLFYGYREMLALGRDTTTHIAPFDLYNTATDSATTFTAGNGKSLLLAFTADEAKTAHDSLISQLNKLYKDHKNTLTVVEISLLPDSTQWHRQATGIKPEYTRCWEPGGRANPSLQQFNVGPTPWFILADTTGTVTYMGNDLNSAILGL